MEDTEEAKEIYKKGIEAYRAGEYEEALQALHEARQIYHAAQDQKAEADVLNDLGVVYVQMEQWDQADQYLGEALNIRMALLDRSGQGITLGNLGMMYDHRGDGDQAIQAYEQAIEIFRELGERGNEKAVASQLNKIKIRKRRFLDALGTYQEGLAGEEEPSGAQKLARRMFSLLGHLSGGMVGTSETDEVPQDTEED
jgi:tetratricopeptide (TPR) repeat protein